MKVESPSALPLLRSPTQGKLLSHLLEDPTRQWSVRELARCVGTSEVTALREVRRAEQAGYVAVERVGNRRVVTADTRHPLFEPLRTLLVATFGAPRVIADELADVNGVAEAHIVGSWARAWSGQRCPIRDLDILVVGDGIDRGELYDAAERIEQSVSFPVDVTVRSSRQWRDPDTDQDPWLAEVITNPRVPVLGPDDGGDDA